jgi:hypothetical protein
LEQRLALATQIKASESATADGERKTVTALFADIKGQISNRSEVMKNGASDEDVHPQ